MPGKTSIEWRKIPGFENYEISDGGDIRRAAAGRGTYVGRQLRQMVSEDGYHYVIISTGRRATRRKLWVHRAVLMAFVGPRPVGHETRHLDGVRSNNLLTNLAWGTRIENTNDKRRHGTIPRGGDASAAKLMEDEVRQIRELHGTVSLRELGRRYGVSHTAIRRAALGIKWAHLE